MACLAVLMDKRRRFAFREVIQSCFHDRLLVATNGPSRPLRLLVHGAVDRQSMIGNFIRVIAPQDALLIDRQLHDELRVLVLVTHHREDADG